MWTYNGKQVKEGRAWTGKDGVQHPSNWGIWSTEEKVSRGLVWAESQQKPDGRFYWFSQNKDGTYTSNPRALEDRVETDDSGVKHTIPGLKSEWVTNTKQAQGALLSNTDWALIRKSDTGEEVPAAVQKYRNAVRQAATDIEAAIVACKDLDSFKKLFETSESGTPINNWPEEF